MANMPAYMLLAILTVALVANLVHGFHVYALRPDRAENRAVAAFAWIVALWTLNDLLFWGLHGPQTDGMLWARAAFLLAVAMHVVSLRFAWLFPEHQPMPRGLLITVALVSTGAMAMILLGRPLEQVGFVGGRFVVVMRAETFAIGASVLALQMAGLSRVWRRRQRAESAVIRRQLTVILAAQASTAFVAGGAAAGLPLFGNYGFLPYAGVGLLAGTIIQTWGVIEMRLLRQGSVLDRLRLFPLTAKVALAVGLCALLTVGLVLGGARAALGDGVEAIAWQRAAMFGLVLSTLPALALMAVVLRGVTRPLRRLTEAALEVAGGRTDLRLEVNNDARDEVGVLVSAFNEMVGRLEHDLHALQTLGEAMVRAERLAVAGTLAAGIAHEVNNPLAAISSLVQSARERTDDARARQMLEEAVRQVERVAGVLQELMDFSRPGAGAPTPCDPGELVAATIQLLRYDRRFRGLPIAFEPGAPQWVLADASRLQQVLVNLLLNAREAIDGPEPGRIAVTVDGDPQDHVVITVSDNGHGIPADDLERIFEPFFTTRPAGAGTGLGLAVCRDLLRQEGGELVIESTPGQGTHAHVSLPRPSREMRP